MMIALDQLTHGAPLAALLLLATAGASLYGLAVSPPFIERNVLRPYALARGQGWATLVTSAFVHADLAHLVFNGITFWAFGFGLERRIGSERFLALYVIGLLASGLGTWLQHRREPEYRTLGASGAILAVLFASIVYTPTASIYMLPIPVPIPAPVFAIAYLAYTVFAAHRRGGRVNHDAHLSGALAGLAFVAATDPAAFGAALRQAFG
ncbi:MAG TPA: rhomboid family intramembrane serine protease [Caldimonas sp.]|nr:rhomboid family intramembrane serine protease [Caldimonas sp.]